MSQAQTPLTFQQELRRLLNKHCIENGSGTPDFILAEYIRASLEAFELGVILRERWYGREMDSRFGTPVMVFEKLSEQLEQNNNE